MGTWSWTILGGDTELDAQIDIEERLEIYDEENIDVRKHNINKNLPSLNIEGSIHFDDDIQMMVLGVIIIEAGADLNEKIKNIILKAIELEIDRAESSFKGDSKKERLHYLSLFHKDINTYDGTVVSVAQEGLLEKLFDEVAAGKVGLLNK